MSLRLGYLIPEFPGQTHIWIWREINHLREWGADITIFSTRRPNTRDRARHAFAEQASVETRYLWPGNLFRIGQSIFWAMLLHPMGFAKCIFLTFRLPIKSGWRTPRLLLMLAPACSFARSCKSLGIQHLHAHSCANSAILCMMVRRLVGIQFSMTLNADIECWGGAMAEKFADAKF